MYLIFLYFVRCNQDDCLPHWGKQQGVVFICDLSIIDVPTYTYCARVACRCGLCTCKKAVYISLAGSTVLDAEESWLGQCHCMQLLPVCSSSRWLSCTFWWKCFQAVILFINQVRRSNWGLILENVTLFIKYYILLKHCHLIRIVTVLKILL